MADSGPQLFHEIYGRYYRIVAHLIERAGKSSLTLRDIEKTVREEGFSETEFFLPQMLMDGKCPIFHKNGQFYETLVKTYSRPLSLLEKRWLAAIAGDERIGLFLEDEDLAALKSLFADVKPLYRQEDFFAFDRSNAPDPFGDEAYRRHFKTTLAALRGGNFLQVDYEPPRGVVSSMFVYPRCLQYSGKDDKFRLFCVTLHGGGNVEQAIVDMGSILNAQILDDFPGSVADKTDIERLLKSCTAENLPSSEKLILRIELSNERGTLERALTHFANFKCVAYKHGVRKIHLDIHYSADDEAELLNSVLAFGPTIRVLSGESQERFLELIKERLRRQMELLSK